jgi:hypothetical protein
MIGPEILILLGVALLGIYIGQRLITSKRRLGRPRGSRNGWSQSKSHGKVDRKTYNKLMRLLGDNRKTIDRLVDNARRKNPYQSEQWYWEKVLYDLERDRWR